MLFLYQSRLSCSLVGSDSPFLTLPSPIVSHRGPSYDPRAPWDPLYQNQCLSRETTPSQLMLVYLPLSLHVYMEDCPPVPLLVPCITLCIHHCTPLNVTFSI